MARYRSNTTEDFDVQVTVHRDKFLSQNQADALIPLIYFWDKPLRVSGSSSVHHQEFFTVHIAMVYIYIYIERERERERKTERGSVL